MAQDIIVSLNFTCILFSFIAENVSMSDGIDRNEFFYESEEYILISLTLKGVKKWKVTYQQEHQ